MSIQDERQIVRWYQRAQIDYTQCYMALYAAFNAWYRGVTGSANDREAITILSKGEVHWWDYCAGRALYALRDPLVLLVECTQREPLSHATPHWRGELQDAEDWPSLLEYWYRVRCLVMHGGDIHSQYVYLAYQTLNLFMAYILENTSINTVYNTSKTSYN